MSDEKLEITRDEAVSVMQGLGFDEAATWKRPKMQTKLEVLHTLVDDDTTIGDEELDNILDDLIYHGANNKPITLVRQKVEPEEPSEDPVPVECKEKKKPKKKPVATPKEEVKEDMAKGEETVPVPEEELQPEETVAGPKGILCPKPPARYKNLVGVRPTCGRSYFLGVALAKLGLKTGISDDFWQEVADLTGKDSRTESSINQAKAAWHVLNGYTRELAGESHPQPKAKRDQ